MEYIIMPFLIGVASSLVAAVIYDSFRNRRR